MASQSGSSQEIPQIAFISGHTDLTQQQFTAHYAEALESALRRQDRLLLGDAKGVDSFALAFLLSEEVCSRHSDVASRITVYASRAYNVPKLKALGVHVVTPDDQHAKTALSGPHETVVVEDKGRDAARYRHIQRDAALTAASDYDILWFRDEEASKALYGSRWRPRISATELNFKRRRAGKSTIK